MTNSRIAAARREAGRQASALFDARDNQRSQIFTENRLFVAANSARFSALASGLRILQSLERRRHVAQNPRLFAHRVTPADAARKTTLSGNR